MKGADIHIRAASSSDLDAAFELFAQVQSLHADAEPAFFRPPEKDEIFARYFESILGDPDQQLLFACVEGREVGYIHYFLGLRPKNIFQPERRVAYIHTLVVAKEHHRTGCASLLIDHVKEAARRQDIALIGIDFWTFNDAAGACFEKAGFKVTKAFMWLDL